MNRDTGTRIAALGPRRANLYGQADTKPHGTVFGLDRFGTDLAMRSATPPPLAAYDEWAKRKNRNARSYDAVHGVQMTGFRLRRIVIMRRAGSTWKECGEASGVSAATASSWVAMLPLALGV